MLLHTVVNPAASVEDGGRGGCCWEWVYLYCSLVFNFSLSLCLTHNELWLQEVSQGNWPQVTQWPGAQLVVRGPGRGAQLVVRGPGRGAQIEVRGPGRGSSVQEENTWNILDNGKRLRKNFIKFFGNQDNFLPSRTDNMLTWQLKNVLNVNCAPDPVRL